jgi:hypothetical protein
LVVDKEGVHPDGLREREYPVLCGPDELTTDLNYVAASDRMVERAPTDPTASFEHQDISAGGGQNPSCRQPGQAGTDDDNLGPTPPRRFRERRRSRTKTDQTSSYGGSAHHLPPRQSVGLGSIAHPAPLISQCCSRSRLHQDLLDQARVKPTAVNRTADCGAPPGTD